MRDREAGPFRKVSNILENPTTFFRALNSKQASCRFDLHECVAGLL